MKLLRQTSKLQQVVLIRVVTRVTSPLTEGSTGTSSVSKLARWLEDGLGAPLLPILLLAGCAELTAFCIVKTNTRT